jgi:hypothetical protein
MKRRQAMKCLKKDPYGLRQGYPRTGRQAIDTLVGRSFRTFDRMMHAFRYMSDTRGVVVERDAEGRMRLTRRTLQHKVNELDSAAAESFVLQPHPPWHSAPGAMFHVDQTTLARCLETAYADEVLAAELEGRLDVRAEAPHSRLPEALRAGEGED